MRKWAGMTRSATRTTPASVAASTPTRTTTGEGVGAASTTMGGAGWMTTPGGATTAAASMTAGVGASATIDAPISLTRCQVTRHTFAPDLSAPVAQLDRAQAYEAWGSLFGSGWARRESLGNPG